MTLGANQIGAYAADLLDLEDQITTLQDSKRDLYATIRDEHGKAEANALKQAVKLSRMDSEKRTERDEIDTEAQRMLAIIEKSRAPRATHAIAKDVPVSTPVTPAAGQGEGTVAPGSLATHIPDAGKMVSDESARVAMGEADASDLDASADQSQPPVGAGEVHTPHQSDGQVGNPPAGAGSDADRQPIQSGEAHQEGAAVGESPTPEPADESGPSAGGENVARANPAKAAGEASSDAPPAPTAADNARKIRPWCLHADDLSKCGGMGRVHCHSCLKAHADAEGLAA